MVRIDARMLATYSLSAIVAWPSSSDHFQPALPNQMQKLERSARGLLLADLPFLDGREAGIEQTSEDRLADMRVLANALDLGRSQRLDRGQAELIELAQRDLVDHTGLVQALRRLVDGFKNG